MASTLKCNAPIKIFEKDVMDKSAYDFRDRTTERNEVLETLIFTLLHFRGCNNPWVSFSKRSLFLDNIVWKLDQK